MKPLEMTQAAAAKTLGMPTVRLNELVRGKRGVTADTALRLAHLFKTTPQFVAAIPERVPLLGRLEDQVP